MPGGVRGGSAPPTEANHHPSSIFLYNYYCYNWGVKPPNKIINTSFTIILLFSKPFSTTITNIKFTIIWPAFSRP